MRKARGSVDEGEGPVQLAGLENVEDQDDDKRAPETPRQDDVPPKTYEIVTIWKSLLWITF
mgnify:CR=1 FL=1